VFEIVDGNRARELAPGLSDRIVRGVPTRTACTPSIPTRS
jgi:hypothetical protein